MPADLEELIDSKLSSLRLEAVRNLEILLHGSHPGRRRAALAALKNLTHDDSKKVASGAVEALKRHEQEAEEIEGKLASAPRKDERSTDIFISYAREDRETAKALAQVLGARGWKVWWDRKIAPGDADGRSHWAAAGKPQRWAAASRMLVLPRRPAQPGP